MNFSQRFDIKVNLAEAQRRFINRVFSTVFEIPTNSWVEEASWRQQITSGTALRLGERLSETGGLDSLVGHDFLRCLQAIEVFYELAGGAEDEERIKNHIEISVKYALSLSEVDLAIEWHEGIFTRKGAKLLDDSLVNENLHWLREYEYEGVRKPFEKALHHFLESGKRPEVLSDVVTDAYESLEALAKIVTGKTFDLSKNRELFLSQVNAPRELKDLLKQYIEFANEFRHGADPQKPKPTLTEPEVEFFLYMTGAFIRMAKESMAEKK